MRTSATSEDLGAGSAPTAPASSSLTRTGALGTTAAVICRYRTNMFQLVLHSNPMLCLRVMTMRSVFCHDSWLAGHLGGSGWAALQQQLWLKEARQEGKDGAARIPARTVSLHYSVTPSKCLFGEASYRAQHPCARLLSLYSHLEKALFAPQGCTSAAVPSLNTSKLHDLKSCSRVTQEMAVNGCGWAVTAACCPMDIGKPLMQPSR